MLSILDVVLLVISVQVVSGSPLRRFHGTGSSPTLLTPSIPTSTTSQSIQRRVDSTGDNIIAANSGFAGPSASFLSSLLRFHQTATAFSTAAPAPEPTGNTEPATSRPLSTTQTTPVESVRTTQAQPSSPNPSQFTSQPDPNNSQPPGSGRSGSHPEDGVTTTTLTVTETILPKQHSNTSVPSTGVVRHTSFQTGTTRRVGAHETGFGRPSSATGTTNVQTLSSQPTQGDQQPTPQTTFFVLGSSTLRVTVTSGRGGVPTSQTRSSAIDGTTTTVTRMRTRFSTTTVVPESSPTSTRQDSSVSSSNRETGAVATGQSTTQTFPDFSFAPTSAHTSSSAPRPHRTTVLPSIVTPSASVSSSDVATSSSSAIESHSPSSSVPSSSQPSSTTTGMAGITIIPVNPDATTIYVTVTQTDAGATTTVARETVTAQPCRGRRCRSGQNGPPGGPWK